MKILSHKATNVSYITFFLVNNYRKNELVPNGTNSAGHAITGFSRGKLSREDCRHAH